MIPKKYQNRIILEKTGLRVNTQIWIKAKDNLQKISEIVEAKASRWPNLGISTGLIHEKEGGRTPLLPLRKPQEYQDVKFLKEELKKLEGEVEKYSGQVGWDDNDYLRFFSSPLGINHLFVGVSVHFDISQFMKGRWGEVRKSFPLMPVLLEAQQGTWPRYLNTEKSSETIDTFISIFMNTPHKHWKTGEITKIKNPLVFKAVFEALIYLSDKDAQLKIFKLAREMNFDWIGFDAQYIAENGDGHEMGFRIYDFNGVKYARRH